MPTFTTSYVYFGSSGQHTRQPRTITSYGGFTPIPGLNPGPSGTLVTGTSYTPGNANPTETVGTATLDFAFVNVSGCVEGPLNSFVATAMPTGTVGSSPIAVLYVYLPTGGPSIGGSGAVIDAFNESTGSLVDNDFVTVSPDPGGALTSEANEEGWADTSSSGYTITADHPHIGAYGTWPTTPLFDQWVDLADPAPPSSLISGANLTPGKGVTVYALAFYKNPMKSMRSKEYFKEIENKIPLDLVKFVLEGGGKGPQEVINPGNIIGDPEVIAAEMGRLQERLATLEAIVGEKGSAFIKSEDRPQVGKPKPKKR